jgi:two-component system OmpR family response regulator
LDFEKFKLLFITIILFMATDLNNKYIFLVDDEPIQNEMLKDYLSERFAYKIKTYASGEEAMKDIDLSPDIAVLDFHLNSHLPNAQNGVEVLKNIKSASPHTQCIMLSGQDKLEVAVDSMKYGAYDYVIKGETAFSRMENILNNIIELRSVKAANGTYKKIITLLIISVFVVAALGVGLAFYMQAHHY